MKKEALTFDDVQILPTYSEIESRDDVEIDSQLTKNFRLNVPVIASPMDTVCELKMALTLNRLGAAGAMHRFLPIKDAERMVNGLMQEVEEGDPIIGTIGATGDYQDRADILLAAGANILLIDVAHGDHIHVKRALTWLNGLSTRIKFDVIAGNVATGYGARRLEDWGADAIRVGIGGGSMCETRIRTGIGVPQLQALMDVASTVTIPIICDGGIRYPGDVAKAIAAGADTVMIGSMFAGTFETPGDIIKIPSSITKEYHIGAGWRKAYRGSASALAKNNTESSGRYIEGAATTVPYKGEVKLVIKNISDGLRSAYSYVGARNTTEFQRRVEFVRITSSGIVEAKPHGLK